MKKQSLRIFLIGIFTILAVSSAHAQSGSEQTADIPFPFVVGSKTFPAGEYRVQRLNQLSSQAALAIKSIDGRLSKIVLMTDIPADKADGQAKLVFNRYGDKYFLSQVWMRMADGGLALRMSHTERMLARNIEKNGPEATATIALRLRREK